MVTVITTQTRPSVNLPLYFDTLSETQKQAFFNFVYSSPYVVTAIFEWDIDNLINTSIATYPDEASLNSFLAEFNQVFPTFMTDREEYSINNGIIVTRQVS
jgi:hypothetical protein